MKTVQNFTVTQGTRVTFLTQPPGAGVVTYGAKLFKRTGGQFVQSAEWTQAELEGGQATFVYDAGPAENYEIDLGAQATALTMLEASVTFDTPPAFTKKTDLDPSEGLIVRVWRFEPF